MILACIPLAMVCLPAIKPAAQSVDEPDADARQARHTPLGALVIGLLLGTVAVQAARVMPQGFLAPYITETLHGSVMLAGLAYSATAATLALSARWWAKRFAGLPVHVTLGRVCALTAVCGLTALWQGVAQGKPRSSLRAWRGVCAWAACYRSSTAWWQKPARKIVKALLWGCAAVQPRAARSSAWAWRRCRPACSDGVRALSP